jgi:hypothetical protein
VHIFESGCKGALDVSGGHFPASSATASVHSHLKRSERGAMNMSSEVFDCANSIFYACPNWLLERKKPARCNTVDRCINFRLDTLPPRGLTTSLTSPSCPPPVPSSAWTGQKSLQIFSSHMSPTMTQIVPPQFTNPWSGTSKTNTPKKHTG